jgi:hypothetical protein
MSASKPRKSDPYTLVNGNVRNNVMEQLFALPLDGTWAVVFHPVGSKSSRQRGLQHIWYDDILKSGIGGEHESGKDILDLACKYRWGLPIMIRDDDNFAELYLAYSKKYKSNPEKMTWFVKHNVHTEQFSQSQMAEFLTSIQNYYGIEKGVNLTDPDQKGWGNLLDYAEKVA